MGQGDRERGRELELEFTSDGAALAQLHALSAQFVGHTTLQSLIEAVTDAAIAITSADQGKLQLYDASTLSLQGAAVKGFDAAFLDRCAKIVDRCVCGAALLRRERVIVEDATQRPAVISAQAHELMAEAGVAAVQVTPLLARDGRLLGILSTHWSRPHHPNARTLQLLDLMAREAADLIDHRQREETLRERETSLRALGDNLLDGVLFRLNHGAGRSWCFEYISAGIERMTGTAQDEVLRDASALYDLLPHEDRGLLTACALTSRKNLSPVQIEFRLRHSEADELRWVQLRAVPQRTPDGETVWDGLCLDVTTRRRLQEEREQHLTAVEDANEAKTLFFNTLSHELRTPLAAMLNAVAVLKRPEAEAHRASMLGILERNIRQQARLINDLLDLSRILRGKLEIMREPLDLRDLLVEQVEQARPLAHRAGLDLSLERLDRALRILGDAGRLSQVLSNLIDNAVKYTPPGGVIQISCGIDRERAWVQVADSGVGIRGELLRSIFDPFSQGDSGPDRTGGGLGLGLSVSRSLTDLHGGELIASSAGHEQGSVFTLWLPLLRVGSAKIRKRPVQAELFGNKRVLLIEDHPDLRWSLVIMLEMLGHSVFSAANGTSGIELAQSERPDVAIIDIGLPDVDGYEVVRRLREEVTTRSMRLIALTGYASDEQREQALRAGFDYHLAKPVGEDRLRLVLEGS